MRRNTVIAGLVLIILTAVLVTGCTRSSYVTTGYQGWLIDGDSQHRGYRFRYMNGHWEEALRVRAASNLVVKVQTKKGRLDVELLDPSGLQVIRMSLSGKTNDERTIPGPLPAGTYKLVMDAEKARGEVRLLFE